jgi:hypothetical protein
MFQRVPHRRTGPARPRLWLAAVDGKRRMRPHERVNPIKAPETPIEIEFVGLTPEEQQAALAAFPGGKRFVLKRH